MLSNKVIKALFISRRNITTTVILFMIVKSSRNAQLQTFVLFGGVLVPAVRPSVSSFAFIYVPILSRLQTEVEDIMVGDEFIGR